MMTSSRWLFSGVGTVLVGLLLAVLVAGCGGGSGGTAPGLAPGPSPSASAPTYSAAFHVDVASGEVTVSTPDTAGAKAGQMGTKAVLTGTAVAFESSKLVDEGGSVGVRALQVRVRNQTQRALSNARLLFGVFTNVAAWSDPRPGVQVTTVAGSGAAGFSEGAAQSALLNSPSGVAVDDRGEVYFTDYSNHRVRKLSGGVVSTVAGSGTAGSVDGLAASAQLNSPLGIVFCPRDRALYVAEATSNRLRRIDSSGYVSTIAGTGVAGGGDGTGAVATFNQPRGLATDGNAIFLAEIAGHRVRKIAYAGGDATLPASYTVSTVAGNGTAGAVDGAGSAARFNAPYGLAYGGDGALYVTEYSGHRVRRVTLASASVATIAGTGFAANTDGFGSTATFRNPLGIVALPDRGRGLSLVVADSANHSLRQLRLNGEGTASPNVASSWLVQTLAGAASSGSADGNGTTARFNNPRLLTADGSGNLLIGDAGNHKLRQVRPSGGFFPVGVATGAVVAEPVVLANAAGMFPWAGGAPRPWLACPDLAGGATSEPVQWTFAIPEGVTAFEFTVTLEAASDPYAPVEGAVGAGSPRVAVRTLAGSTTGVNGFVDGLGANARFATVVGMSADAQGVLYVCDADNNSVRRIEPSGRVTTVAGVVGAGPGHFDGRGNVAQLSYPTGVVVVPPNVLSQDTALPAGTPAVCLLVTDLDNNCIRLIRGPYTNWSGDSGWEPWNPAFYEVATIAGDGTYAYLNGPGDVACFCAPSSIAVGPGGIFYVCERSGGNRVRTLQYTGGDPMSAKNWQVRLLAGSIAGTPGYTDASGDNARFNDPRGIAVDLSGNVIIADTYNDYLRKITPDGSVTTLAGSNVLGYVDASGVAAHFDHPWSVACGPDGYLYVADRYNYRVRRVSPTGVVTTVCGTGSSTRGDGAGNASGHLDDLGIAVSASGDLYLSEAECVRFIQRIIDVGDVVASN